MKVEEITKNKGKEWAMAGVVFNDAPALAKSEVVLPWEAATDRKPLKCSYNPGTRDLHGL